MSILKSHERNYIRDKELCKFHGNVIQTYFVKTNNEKEVEVRSVPFSKELCEFMQEKADELEGFKPELRQETLKVFPNRDPSSKPQVSRTDYFLKWTF